MKNSVREDKKKPNASFWVRRARRRDLPTMVRLLEGLFAIESDFEVDSAKQRRGLDLILRTAHAAAWVAESEGHVVGMISVQFMISSAEGGLSGVVEDIVVDAAHQGKGIGTLLLKRAVRWAKRHGALRLQLLCDCRNVSALIFYRKQEWAQTSLVTLRLMQ